MRKQLSPHAPRFTTLLLSLALVLVLSPRITTAKDDGVDETDEQSVMNAVPNGASPHRDGMRDYAQMIVISSDIIKMSGATNIEEILSQLPSLSLGGNKASHPQGKGIVRAEIRNLGTGRMLVLVNGRRTIGSGGSIVDMSIIPVEMVERVEIILGGAGAVYGADAVSGVVNIVLRQDFEGFEVGANAGISTMWDGEKVGAYTFMGSSNDKGNVSMSFGWDHRSPVYQRDRSWASPPCDSVTFNEVGEVESICGSLNTPGGNGYFHGLDLQYQIDAPAGWIFDGDGEYHAFDTIYQGQGDYDAYNFGEQMILSGQSDKFQFLTSGHYELSRFATAYMEGLFSYQKHGGRYAGEPVGSGTALYPGPLMVPLSNPYIPQSFFEGVINYYGIDESSPYLEMSKRVNDIGARIFDTTTNVFRAVVGLRGDLNSRNSYDIYFGYGNYTAIDALKNSVDVQRFHTSLDPEVCIATPECVLANIFGTGTMQEEVREFIGFDRVETQKWDTIDGAVRFSTRPFELPGGSFRAVIGGDVRWERGHSELDSKAQDRVIGAFDYTPTLGSYNAEEAFIDMSVPFLGNMPFTYLLTIDLSGRASYFSTFGSVFTYRGQLSWAPWRDILFRGAYSTSYRAPSITEMHKGIYSEMQELQDPCANWGQNENVYLQQQCQAAGVPEDYKQAGNYLRTENGGNPDLEPELSTTLNVGVVVAPTFTPDNMPLAITFDYYRTWLTGIINRIGGQVILDNCYTDPAFSDYCDFLERNENGDIDSVAMTYKNISEIYTAGFDMSFSLGFPIWRTVSANLGFQRNVLTDYIESSPEIDYSEEDVEPSDYAGVIFTRSSGLPKQRFLATFSLAGSTWRLDNQVRYIRGMNIDKTDSESNPYYKVASVYYWDMSGMLKLGDFDFVLGTRNILDKIPPFLPGSAFNASPQVYDVVGRYLYVNLSYTFD